MPFIDPQQARRMYENKMKGELYSAIESNPSLKNYVDDMYLRERFYENFIGLEILVFVFWLLIFYIIPQVDIVLSGAVS